MNSEFLPQYAAQAVVDLENTVKDIKRMAGSDLWRHRHSMQSMLGIAGLIRAAVHVVLPPNGEIYRDNQFGGTIPSESEKQSFEGLPAPVTCFEYPWTHPRQPTDETVGTKRITLAVDLGQLDRTARHPLPADYVRTVQIYSVYYHEQFKVWAMYPGCVGLPLPLDIRPNDTNKDAWAMVASYKNLDTNECADPKGFTPHEAKCLGEFRADINAVIQCCHSLRAGARFEEKREPSGSRRWKFDKRGVGGFTYHVLTIPTRARESGEHWSGGHASPRFHVRRHHIRTLASGELTFVRQCFVGDKNRGMVKKNYEVKDARSGNTA